MFSSTAPTIPAPHQAVTEGPFAGEQVTGVAPGFIELAAALVPPLFDLPTERVIPAVNEVLGRLADALALDYVGIGVLSDQQADGMTTGYYLGAGGLPSPPAGDYSRRFPWAASQLRLGRHVILAYPFDDLPPEAGAERAFAAQLGLKSSLTIPLRNGEQLVGIWTLSSLTRVVDWSPVLIDTLTALAAVVAGVLRRRQLEDAARRNEEQLQVAIRSANLGIWIWDLAEPSRSFCSDNMAKLYGDTEAILSVDGYIARVHPDDRAAVNEVVRQCLQGDASTFTTTHRTILPGEGLRWLEVRGQVVRDAQGAPCRITGAVLDVTKRIEAETQIEAQRRELLRRARLMAQTERMGEIGGWEWDLRTDCLHWTDEVYRIHGLDPTGSPPNVIQAIQYYAANSAPHLIDAMRRLIELGEPYDLRVQLTTATGQEIWVRTTGHAEFDGARITRVYGTIQNVTARTEIEEQLRHAQKMEAVGQLAGGIAHDFNNLLTAINGLSELGSIYVARAENTPTLARVRGYFDEIRRAGERAATLTQQLLAFSRRQVMTPKLLDLGEVVTGMHTMLYHLLDATIDLQTRLHDALPPVLADRSQIEQVLLNLAVNARDAMPHGGVLTVELAPVEVSMATARTHDVLPGAYVQLRVADTGVGMTDEVKARIFDPFFTTKAVGKGTGLGLATVYGIVKQSGGLIEVESAPGQGTTFWVYLPQAQSPAAPALGTDSAPVARGGSETVLVVEDEAWVRHVIRAGLEAKGYTVLEAANGRDALELCQSHAGALHLLIVDVVLPALSGTNLAAQVRYARPDVKLLFISGYHTEGLPDLTTFGTQANFLSKPFSAEVLAARVRHLLDSP